MASNYTISDVIAALHSPSVAQCQAPAYTPSSGGIGSNGNYMLAVESMKDHMTDEGWQIALALNSAGYELVGKGLATPITDCYQFVAETGFSIKTCVVQDKREWDVQPRNFRDPSARFTNVPSLQHPSIFKLTILKDSQSNPPYHKESADEMGAHGWIVYYHPRIVAHLAPYVRPQHLVRTWHSIDPSIIPLPPKRRGRGLLSGAVSGAYPLRQKLIREFQSLPEIDWRRHPGYHRNGCDTKEYYFALSQYKVAICTASRYGYALRKIIEATACGCVVLTDLPEDEVMPGIDENLARVHPSWSVERISNIIKEIYAGYDPERQQHYAEIAKKLYDYKTLGCKLAADIEELRCTYTRP